MKGRMPDKKPTAEEGKAQLHNVRFYTIKPRAVLCMAYSKLLQSLAISRDDGTIELWNMRYAPHLELVIPPLELSQIESLAWAGKRLFSVGLTGKLIEWDLLSLQPRFEHSPTGNALWCLDINDQQTELAVGSEEGHINIMSIEHDELSYKSLFQKQDGRVLCCKFDRPGKHLITGSIGSIRIWNVSKGNTLHQMTLSGPQVKVWSLQVLSDFTIISGDSAGYVTVWNGENASQVEACKILNSNVFALAVNEREDRLVCSGMNPPLIRVLSRTQIKREESQCERWIKFLQRDVHKHFVKSLIVLDDRIISAGEDGLLCISSASKTQDTVAKYAPLLPGICCSVSSSAKLLLLRYPNCLQLWRLGVAKSNEATLGCGAVGSVEELLLERTPDKLLQLNVNQLLAAAISPDAKWMCYSTRRSLRLCYLKQPSSESEEQQLSVHRLTADLPAELEPASHIIFSKDSKSLLLLHVQSQQLRVFTLENEQVRFAYSLELSSKLSAPITNVEHSEDYLVVASVDQLIAVWQLNSSNQSEAKHLLNLPRYKAATTALALQQSSLVVAYADGRIVEYDLTQRRFSCETDKHFVANSKTHCIRGIVLDAQKPSIIVVYNEVYLYVLERVSQEEAALQGPGGKAKRLSNVKKGAGSVKYLKLKFQLPREHLVEVCRLGPKELVTVCVETSSLMEQLPPPYQRKKFGAS